jgi:DNA-directed RNA polymerase specialized sigma24 family protein
MSQADPVAEWVQRLQQGDARAAEMIFARYAEQLTRLAERHLSQRLAGRLDGGDVVQAAFRAFFTRAARGDFRLDNSPQLWRMLAKITLHKAWAASRYHTAAMRDVHAEELDGRALRALQPSAHGPGPVEAATQGDQIEALVRGLAPWYGEVLEMRLRGYAVAEIARQLDRSRQTVYRALQLLRQRFEYCERGTRPNCLRNRVTNRPSAGIVGGGTPGATRPPTRFARSVASTGT